MTTERYYIKQFARNRWHVIGPNGVVYDNEPHGKDRPLIFQDEDAASDYAAWCNLVEDEEEE